VTQTPHLSLPQFNPSVPLQADAQEFQQSVNLHKRIHCVVYVMDTCKVSIMSTKLEEKLAAIRRRVNLLGQSVREKPGLKMMDYTDYTSAIPG
jgi:hypothetical protein